MKNKIFASGPFFNCKFKGSCKVCSKKHSLLLHSIIPSVSNSFYKSGGNTSDSRYNDKFNDTKSEVHVNSDSL